MFAGVKRSSAVVRDVQLLRDVLDHRSHVQLAFELFRRGCSRRRPRCVVVAIACYRHNDRLVFATVLQVVVVAGQQKWCGIEILFVECVHEAALFARALFLEEEPDIVDGEDDALAGRLFGVNVDATHQHRIGAVEQREQQERGDVREDVAQIFIFCERYVDAMNITDTISRILIFVYLACSKSRKGSKCRATH